MENSKVESSHMIGGEADIEAGGVLETQAAPEKPVVIGVYGAFGSGKSLLLNLREDLEQEGFVFYEDSKVIDDFVPGGLEAFQSLEESEKLQWRQRAMDNIRRDCANSDRTAVLAGPYMFWPESEEEGTTVFTKNDLDVYTHVLYIKVPADIVSRQCRDDTERSHPSMSREHVENWQEVEITQLRDICHNHGVLFSCVVPDSYYGIIRDLNYRVYLPKKVKTLLRDFQDHSEDNNLFLAKRKLDETIAAIPGQLDTMLVMDGDKTLAAKDIGAFFWKKALASDSLKTLFSSSLGYSYTAYRQATLLYDGECDGASFDKLCDAKAAKIAIYPEVRALLRQLSNHTNVGAVVVTSGLHDVWVKLLKREYLADRVKVIGGGRISDGFVVTPGVKGALVTRLQDVHGMYVWVFGNSPLDLEMLKKADRAIVVVGDESSSMDEALMDAINSGGLQAHQTLLPSDVSPRLDTTRLPLVQLTDKEFIDSVFFSRGHPAHRRVFHATDTVAAKLLMTSMRDAEITGPGLRGAHQRAGSYLATEFLTEIVGTESYPIPHTTTGYRLLHEKQTMIVTLRDAEPVALGVNEIFPLAKFWHSNSPNDIEEHRLNGIRNVILVDSVVDTGQSIVKSVEYVRSINATTRIVVVAGVVQTDSISTGRLKRLLFEDANISIVALHLSENKFTDRGAIDTENPLYNTMDLDGALGLMIAETGLWTLEF